jgi:hypothetical protein
MMTIDDEQRAAIAEKLADMTLPAGLGDEHNACSIAAINLALSGKLTDEIPACMSEAIGKWVIVTQDSMPAALRNSHRWKTLLPLAAGTGREHERERLALILDWMWETALPVVQPLADDLGFGPKWQRMTDERSVDAAGAAWAEAAGTAGRAAEDMWDAARYAADAASAAAAAWAAADAADAAANVVRAMAAADAIRAAAVAKAAWESFDPCDLLERLIDEGSAE